MANSELKNKTYRVPDKVYNRINQMLKMVDTNDKHAKGIQRAKDIVSDRKVSYTQMTSLKSFFTNFKGDIKGDEYKLIGGDVTKKWVDNELKQDTDSIRRGKEVRRDAGEENQFKKTHVKDKDNANPTNPYGGMIDITKGKVSDKIKSGDEVYKSSHPTNEAYKKEIDSINYLIEYMNKK